MDTTEDLKKIPDLDEKTRTKPGTLRKIVVDRTKCIGARSCVAVAPGVFQMDDQNLAYLVDPDSEDEDTIMLAAQSCPVLAVIIYDDQGKQIFPEE